MDQDQTDGKGGGTDSGDLVRETPKASNQRNERVRGRSSYVTSRQPPLRNWLFVSWLATIIETFDNDDDDVDGFEVGSIII